jgi:hypothetical protein
MTNQSVQQGREQDIVSEDKRHAERTKRIVEDRLSRRWPRCMTLDDTYRAPSLFTWRC